MLDKERQQAIQTGQRLAYQGIQATACTQQHYRYVYEQMRRAESI